MIGATGLGAILRHPWLATLPTYLETPGMDSGYDAVNLDRALRLARGEPVPPLSAEAFAGHGRRPRAARRTGRHEETVRAAG